MEDSQNEEGRGFSPLAPLSATYAINNYLHTVQVRVYEVGSCVNIQHS